MKKIVGLLLLVGAIGMFTSARMRSAAVDRDVLFFTRMAADAHQRESEMADLMEEIAGHSVYRSQYVGAVTIPPDPTHTGQRAKLAEVQQQESMLGSAAVNDARVAGVKRERWVVMVMYVGSVLAVLIGIGYLVK